MAPMCGGQAARLASPPPAIHEMTEGLAVGVLSGVRIDWERVPGRPAAAGG